MTSQIYVRPYTASHFHSAYQLPQSPQAPSRNTQPLHGFQFSSLKIYFVIPEYSVNTKFLNPKSTLGQAFRTTVHLNRKLSLTPYIKILKARCAHAPSILKYLSLHTKGCQNSFFSYTKAPFAFIWITQPIYTIKPPNLSPQTSGHYSNPHPHASTGIFFH